MTRAKEQKQLALRKELEEDIAQERGQKLLQDAARPPRLPAPPRAQKTAVFLKRKSSKTVVTADAKKTRRDDTPRSPEVTIVPDAEQLISPMVSESTNIPSEVPPLQTDDQHDAESSQTQQRELPICFVILFISSLSSFDLLSYSIDMC